MARNAVLVGSDIPALMQVAVELRGMPVTIVDSGAHPLAHALGAVRQQPAALLVLLNGDENVVSLRTILAAAPATRFVFVAREMPLRSTLSRIVHEYGGVVVSARERPIVIAATVISILAQQGDLDRAARHE